MKVIPFHSIMSLAIVLFAGNVALSQPVYEAWVARYNGPGNSSDQANALAVDASGNVYVTGISGVYPNFDYATVKYDASGVQQWVARYDGPGNDYDHANALAVDASGSVYVTGSSNSSVTSTDYATIKYDASGIQQWVARYDGPGNLFDNANALAVDVSGNVYVTGSSNSSVTSTDYATIKYDASGVQQWVARYNGPGNSSDQANALAVDVSGNVYVTGHSWGSGTIYDYATIKYDASGVQQWVARYNGPENLLDYANALAVDDSGNVYVTGSSYYSSVLFSDCATIKYDASGVQQWVAGYSRNYDDYAYALAVDASGNVYVTGWSSYDYVTIKYDASGVEQWARSYNGLGSRDDGAVAVAIDGTGNVYVTGHSYHEGSLDEYATIKYDASGARHWVARYNGSGNDADRANALAVDASGNVYVTGYSTGSGTSRDYATIKYIQGIPPPVTLFFPPHGSIITSDSLRLIWNQNPAEPDRYWLEGDTDSLFSTPFTDSLLTDTAYTLFPLHHNTMLWWRVKAHTSYGWGPFSEVRNFFVYQEIPAPPALLSPDSGVTGIETSLTVSWNASVGTESYGLELSDMPDFSNLIVDEDSIGVTSHEVADLSNNTTYYWRVNAANALGASDWSIIWAFTTLVTGVSSQEIIPTDFSLSQNYPNPFNPSTTIKYGLPKKSHVKLEIYNVLGQSVVVLADGEQEPGYHSVTLGSSHLASGLYLYRIQAGEFVETKKLIILR